MLPGGSRLHECALRTPTQSPQSTWRNASDPQDKQMGRDSDHVEKGEEWGRTREAVCSKSTPESLQSGPMAVYFHGVPTTS